MAVSVRRNLGWLILLPSILVMVGWWLRDFRQTNGDAVHLALPNDAPDPVTYAMICEEISRIRSELSDEYARSQGSQRADLEHDARVWLESVLPELMRCWIGTPWDFNGTAERPGDGAIACGYFVSTVLRDAGFNLDRFLLAKQASENIMRSFLPRASCVLRVGDDYQSYADSLDSCDPGIYLIGLDTHVGFMVKRHHDGFRFIHSSGSNPARVVEQDRENAWVLRQSHWRMLGNLTADRSVIRRWLKGERIHVHGINVE